MFDTIINAISDNERKTLQEAQRRYAELLRSGEVRDGTEAELRKLVAILRKPAAELRADYDAVRNWQRLRRVIADGSGLDVAKDKAIRAVEAHREKTEKIIEERRRQQVELGEQSASLERRYLEAQSATHALAALQQSRPDLFGDCKIPSTSDL